MTGEERAKIDDLYTKAIEWADEGIRLWTDEEAVKSFVNAAEAPEKVAMFRFVKKCMETAYPILKGEERILMGEAERQPVGIAKTVCRDEVKQLLLEQMKMLSDVCKGLQKEGGYIEDKCITLCSLTERMEHISSEIRAHDQSSQNPLGRIANKSESNMGLGFTVVPEEAGQE